MSPTDNFKVFLNNGTGTNPSNYYFDFSTKRKGWYSVSFAGIFDTSVITDNTVLKLNTSLYTNSNYVASSSSVGNNSTQTLGFLYQRVINPTSSCYSCSTVDNSPSIVYLPSSNTITVQILNGADTNYIYFNNYNMYLSFTFLEE